MWEGCHEMLSSGHGMTAAPQRLSTQDQKSGIFQEEEGLLKPQLELRNYWQLIVLGEESSLSLGM